MIAENLSLNMHVASMKRGPIRHIFVWAKLNESFFCGSECVLLPTCHTKFQFIFQGRWWKCPASKGIFEESCCPDQRQRRRRHRWWGFHSLKIFLFKFQLRTMSITLSRKSEASTNMNQALDYKNSHVPQTNSEGSNWIRANWLAFLGIWIKRRRSRYRHNGKGHRKWLPSCSFGHHTRNRSKLVKGSFLRDLRRQSIGLCCWQCCLEGRILNYMKARSL